MEKLEEAIEYVGKFTKFHRFDKLMAEDIRTGESGLNLLVLVINNGMVLFPMNELLFETKKKSQIRTYLDHNKGHRL